MEQLNNTIKRLTQFPNKSVTIINLDTGDKIVCNRKGSAILEEFGSIEAFFDSIYKSGISKIRIADRNPSGTSSTPEGEPYTISLVSPGESNSSAEVKQKTSVLEQPKPPIMPGLNGDFASIGMNAAQIDLAGKLYDYPRLVAELQNYKSKSERLETELQDLKTKVIVAEALDGKSVAKTEANAKFMEPFAPLMAAVAERFLGPAPIAEPLGLAGTANFSAIKQRVVSIIGQQDDSVVFSIGKLMEKLNDDAVWTDFEQLLDKHNLAPTV